MPKNIEEIENIILDREKAIELRNENERKLICFSGICFFIMLLSTFVLTICGVIDLRIINNEKFPSWINYIGNFLMFMANMYFMVNIILKNDKRNKLIIAGFIPIYVIYHMFFMVSYMLTFVMPLLYILLWNAKNKHILKLIIRYIVFAFVISIYQLISSYIKLNIFQINLIVLNNIATQFLYSIDLYLLYAIIYKGVKLNGLETVFRKFGRLVQVCKGAVSFDKMNAGLPMGELKPYQRVVYWGGVLVWFLFTFGLILLLGNYNVGLAETLIIIIVFELARNLLGNKKHSKSLSGCSAISIPVFYVLTRLSFAFHISLFWGIALSIGFTYAVYLYAINVDELSFYRKAYEVKSKIDIKDIPSSAYHYFTAEQIEIIERKKKGHTHNKISEYLHMSVPTLTRRILDIKRIYSLHISS